MEAETQTQREDGHVKMEVETGVTLPQEKCLGHQKLKEAKKNTPQWVLEGVWPATTLTSELWPPEVGKNTFLLFQATQFGTQQPWETNPIFRAQKESEAGRRGRPRAQEMKSETSRGHSGSSQSREGFGF